MKRRKIIIWSFILVAALGLNSFATEGIQKQIKSFSQEAVNDLAIALQNEKEIVESRSLEKLNRYNSDPQIHHPIIKLNEKVVVKDFCKSYIFKLPQNLSNKYRIKENYLKWNVKRDANALDYIKHPIIRLITNPTVEFIVRSPGWSGINGITPIPGTLEVNVTKHIYTPNVEFYITATEGEGKNPGALWLNWKVYKNRTGKKRIAILERINLTFGDLYGN